MDDILDISLQNLLCDNDNSLGAVDPTQLGVLMFAMDGCR